MIPSDDLPEEPNSGKSNVFLFEIPLKSIERAANSNPHGSFASSLQTEFSSSSTSDTPSNEKYKSAIDICDLWRNNLWASLEFVLYLRQKHRQGLFGMMKVRARLLDVGQGTRALTRLLRLCDR